MSEARSDLASAVQGFDVSPHRLGLQEKNMKRREPGFPPLCCHALGALPAVAQKSEYNVALDGTFAPHAMPTLSGGVEGFNVDLANEIGKRLGVKMNITAAQWSGLLPAMQAGKYDFIVAPRPRSLKSGTKACSSPKAT